jgi:spore coat protein H
MKSNAWMTGVWVIGWSMLVLGPARGAMAAEADDELYGAPRVLQLKIEMPQAQLEALRKDPKTYVKGTVREGDKAYPNVAIRLKGASSVQLLDKKPSLALKFDEFENGLYFHGHAKIMLNNAHVDPTYLCEWVGGEIFRAAGVPAAKVTFARVELNGRDAGLYVLAQAPNRDFLADHFKKTKGNFYEGDNTDVTDKLRLDSGNGPKEQADVRKLADAAREGNPAERLKKLGAVLDVERFLSFMACEVFLWHRSGYTLEHDNYRLYHDPVSDRMVFIPDALDGAFGQANGALAPDGKGIVARGILQSPEGQRLYRERMGKLLATAFKADALQGRLNDLAGKIRPVVARDSNEARAFDAALARLRDTIGQRVKFLEEELKKPAKGA